MNITSFIDQVSLLGCNCRNQLGYTKRTCTKSLGPNSHVGILPSALAFDSYRCRTPNEHRKIIGKLQRVDYEKTTSIETNQLNKPIKQTKRELLLTRVYKSLDHTSNLAKNQTEDVVEDEVLLSILNKVEDLRVAFRMRLLVNGELACDHDDNVAAVWRARLSIKRGYFVLSLLERKRDELLDNSLRTLHLSRFESHHRDVTVEGEQTRPIGLKLLVVDLDKLLGERGEIEGHWVLSVLSDAGLMPPPSSPLNLPRDVL